MQNVHDVIQLCVSQETAAFCAASCVSRHQAYGSKHCNTQTLIPCMAMMHTVHTCAELAACLHPNTKPNLKAACQGLLAYAGSCSGCNSIGSGALLCLAAVSICLGGLRQLAQSLQRTKCTTTHMQQCEAERISATSIGSGALLCLAAVSICL
jgi:hypothetical protein